MSGRFLRTGLVLVALLALGPLAASARYASGAAHRGGGATAAAHRSVKPEPPKAPAAGHNPLLPPPILVTGFFPDMSLLQKVPTITPAGFEPLYSGQDWESYRAQFGAEVDNLARKRSSDMLALANKLIDAAANDPAQGGEGAGGGLARLLLVRAVAVCYRNRDGFPTANKAVEAYQKIMDIRAPAQVGALWTMSNAMSRLAVTPRPERVRYSGIATRANTQLALLMLQADQIEAAQSVIRLVGYHEGYVRGDQVLRGLIAQTRTAVRQTAAMMDYLEAQYQPAIRGDDSALMALYIYGRFVKEDPALVADFPSRKPGSPMAQLAGDLDAADRDPAANYGAAETLRLVASTLPDGILRQRALYAALVHYRAFINAPQTAAERVKRTLSVMAIEGVIGDGARRSVAIHPFDPPKAPAAGNGAVEQAGGATQAARQAGPAAH